MSHSTCFLVQEEIGAKTLYRRFALSWPYCIRKRLGDRCTCSLLKSVYLAISMSGSQSESPGVIATNALESSPHGFQITVACFV